MIGSDNGLPPVRRQAIIWTNAGILLIGPLGTNFSEILIGIQTFPFKKIAFENVVCKMASILSRPQWVNDPTDYKKVSNNMPRTVSADDLALFVVRASSGAVLVFRIHTDWHSNGWLIDSGRHVSNFKSVIFERVSRIKFMNTCTKVARRCMPENTLNDKLTLVRVVGWCCQTTSHYLSRCWPNLCRHIPSLGHNVLNTSSRVDTIQAPVVQTSFIHGLSPGTPYTDRD